MPDRICVDASIAIAVLLREDLSPQAWALWRSWIDNDVELVAPPLFFAEVASVLRQQVYHRRITATEGEIAFQAFMGMNVSTLPPHELQPPAWELAKQFNQPRTYDMQYLAAARHLDCELWTADRRLANAVTVPWLKWLGDFNLP